MVDPRKSKCLPHKTEWKTPPWIFHAFEEALGLVFTLDPCTTADNPLATPHFFTRLDDGLAQSWAGHIVYLNSPGYGDEDLRRWLGKALEEVGKGTAIVAALLPNTTDARWFHELVLGRAAELWIIGGRIRFVDAPGSPRWGSVLAVYKPGTFAETRLSSLSLSLSLLWEAEEDQREEAVGSEEN